MIPLSSRDSRPVWDQVAEGLRRLIQGGGFLPGESLPPAETLAGQMAVNPGAVRWAYATLADQGLLERQESGAVTVAQAAAGEPRETELLNTWDEATVALLAGGYPRRELEKRLKEVGA